MTKLSPFVSSLVGLAVSVLLSGCSVSSEVKSSSAAQPVGGTSLEQVEVGKTTKDWIIGAFGEPTTVSEISPDTEILKYHRSEKTEHRASLWFLFESHTEKEVVSNVYFEIKNGVVQKYWKD